MPSFDLRHIYVAPYQNNNGTVSYGTAISAGDAMTVAMELRFAEARLYAESTLAEYIRKATGGTISMGVKYIPDDAQHLIAGVNGGELLEEADGAAVIRGVIPAEEHQLRLQVVDGVSRQ